MNLTPTIERIITEGAELYCERRGNGPPLLLITGGMGDAGFYSSAANILANEFTVLINREEAITPLQPWIWLIEALGERERVMYQDGIVIYRTLSWSQCCSLFCIQSKL